MINERGWRKKMQRRDLFGGCFQFEMMFPHHRSGFCRCTKELRIAPGSLVNRWTPVGSSVR
jgi:hypothetical protein